MAPQTKIVKARKRKMEPEWIGSNSELRRRVLGSPSYQVARCRLTAIKSVRKELSSNFIDCLELQMKLRFGEVDDAFSFMHEMRRDHKHFIQTVILHIADEYKRHGLEGIIEFRDILSAYRHDDLMDIFSRVVHQHPRRASDLWLTLVTLRIDCCSAASIRLLECLKEGCKPTHGMFNFGNSVLSSNFHGLMPDQIFLICDSIVESSVNECFVPIHGVYRDARVACEQIATRFLLATYPFFHGVLQRLGLPIMPLHTRSTDLVRRMLPRLPSIWNPPVIRAVAYMLAVLRLKLPDTKKNQIVLPFSPSFTTFQPTVTRRSILNENMVWRPTLQQLASLSSRMNPTTPEFTQAAEMAGASEVFRWAAISLLYTNRFQECEKFCKHMHSKGIKDVVIQTVYITVLNMLHRRNETIEGILKLWKLMEEGEVEKKKKEEKRKSSRRKEKEEVQTTEKHVGPVVFLFSDQLPQWSSHLMTSVILSSPTTHAGLLTSMIVFSQVDYENSGYRLLNSAFKRIEKKGSFTSPGLLDLLTNVTVLERSICLLSNESNKIDLGIESPIELICKKISETVPENQSIAQKRIFKMASAYLEEHQADIIKTL